MSPAAPWRAMATAILFQVWRHFPPSSLARVPDSRAPPKELATFPTACVTGLRNSGRASNGALLSPAAEWPSNVVLTQRRTAATRAAPGADIIRILRCWVSIQTHTPFILARAVFRAVSLNRSTPCWLNGCGDPAPRLNGWQRAQLPSQACRPHAPHRDGAVLIEPMKPKL